MAKLSFDKWFDKYRPIKNPFNPEGSCEGTMFETYGEELAFVQARNNDLVWTQVEVDGKMYIIPGFHRVNRFSYYITELPWTDPDIEIKVD
jgi:hypothetical protein